jgi:hypothetical protein
MALVTECLLHERKRSTANLGIASDFLANERALQQSQFMYPRIPAVLRLFKGPTEVGQHPHREEKDAE